MSHLLNMSDIVCEMFRDSKGDYGHGHACKGNHKVYLVINNADRVCRMICGKCLWSNMIQFGNGTLIFEIGDNVTHHFF